jgi:hypothetical protein
MAHAVHQHHVEAFELPSGLYWAAGITRVLAFVLIYFSMTNSTDLAPVSASFPEPPAAPCSGIAAPACLLALLHHGWMPTDHGAGRLIAARGAKRGRDLTWTSEHFPLRPGRCSR